MQGHGRGSIKEVPGETTGGNGGTHLEIERKWLVERAPAPEVLETLGRLDMVQVYVQAPGERRSRVRTTTWPDGTRTYHLTTKERLVPGSTLVRVETEEQVTKQQAKRLVSRFRLPGWGVLHKVRYLVEHEGRTWELDHITEPVAVWVLEVEVRSVDENPPPPPWLDVVAELTELEGWTCAALARSKAVPRPPRPSLLP
jgi:CYTH domain-containing protein